MITLTSTTGTNTLTLKGTGDPNLIVADIDWLSSSGGAVAAALNDVSGEIVRVTFVPDAGGTQPTNAYDVTLTDAEGIDVLAGKGGNLSNAAASSVVPLILDAVGTPADTYAVGHRFFVAGKLTLAIANAGNAKGGRILLYLRKA